MDKRIKLVVIDEHTLGYIDPNSMKLSKGSYLVSILHASVLRGSYYNGMGSSICVNKNLNKIRLANQNDFDNFRVCFNGFNNPNEYKFATINKRHNGH